MLRSREAESRAEGESYAAYDSLPQYRRSGVHTPTASAKVARTDEVVALSDDAPSPGWVVLALPAKLGCLLKLFDD